MAIWFECICGSQNEADPGPEGLVTCPSCGAELDFAAVLQPAVLDPAVLDPAGANDPNIPDPKLDCPGCGGRAEVIRQGVDGRDRILSCLYCGTEVDLPEVRGTTRERVTERPGQRITERVTSWEGAEPSFAGPFHNEDREVTFETDGQGFDSIEAMERHLREQLPEDVVQQALDAMRSAIDADDTGDGTTRVEHTEITTERRVLPRRPRR